MNYYRYLFGLVTVLTTWKLVDRPQSNETLEDGRTNSLSLKQLEKQFTTILMEEKRQEKQTQPQLEKVLNDDLFVKPALTFFSGSLPLDSVLFLLIQTCGADLVSSVFSVLHFVFSWLDLVVTVTLTIYTWKRRREKTELLLQRQMEDVFATVMQVKAELEKQRRQLQAQLEEVEQEREGNKQSLQTVEKEITERETMFDKPEELLREKENLLRKQWKLDQMKKDTEKQLLSTERLMELIESQMEDTQENTK